MGWIVALVLPALASCGGGANCGTGTQLVSGSCVVSAAGPSPLASVVVSGLAFDGDATTPLEVGHRLPISLALQGTPRGAPSATTVPVQVSVRLVSTDATPRSCVVGGDIVNVPADGQTVAVAPELVIPPGCLPTGTTMARFNVAVSLTLGEDTNPLTPPAGTQTVLTFTPTRVANAALPEAQCRLTDGAADARCALELGMQRPASAAADITFGIALESTVGTLWPRTPPVDLAAGATEAPRPNLALEVDTRAYGNDPNSSDDDALPGAVRLAVSVGPAEGDDVGHWEPVPFRRHLDGSDAPQTTLEYTSLNSGRTEQDSLYLYLPDAVQDRMLTGAWQSVGLYTLRVCEVPANWTSEHLATDEDPALVGETRSDADANCRDRTVRFARSSGATLSTARRSHWSLVRILNRSNDLFGTLALGAAAVLSPAGAGAGASGLAHIQLFGWSLTVLNAEASATATPASLPTSGVKAGLTVMNNVIFSVDATLGAERERAVTRTGSLMRESCRSKTFLVKVIPVTVQGCARGELGLRGELAVGGGAQDIPSQFPGSPAHAYVRLGVTPFANAGLSLSAGIGVSGLSAGVYGDVTLVDLEVPATMTGRIGLPATGVPLRAFGNMSVDIGLTFLKGAFGVYAEVPIWGRSQYEIASWDGLPGFGSRGSMINVISRDTPVFSL